MSDGALAPSRTVGSDAVARGAGRVVRVRSAGRTARAQSPRRASPYRTLTRAQLPIDTITLARYLLGKLVVRTLPEGIVSGRIVETEAYVVGDAAAHAFRGMTPRNRSLFLARGHAYVYLAYGLCYLLNVSSEAPGVGAGVLIRALEPLDGIPIMQRHRHTTRLRDLARGPGRLAQALRIDRQLDGIDLCRDGQLRLARGDFPALARSAIKRSVRIGITRDAQRLLRFYLSDNAFVSGPRSLQAARGSTGSARTTGAAGSAARRAARSKVRPLRRSRGLHFLSTAR